MEGSAPDESPVVRKTPHVRSAGPRSDDPDMLCPPTATGRCLSDSNVARALERRPTYGPASSRPARDVELEAQLPWPRPALDTWTETIGGHHLLERLGGAPRQTGIDHEPARPQGRQAT